MSSVQDHFDNKHVPGGTPWYVANAIGLPSGGCIGISDAPASLPLQWFHRHANQSDIAPGRERKAHGAHTTRSKVRTVVDGTENRHKIEPLEIGGR